MPLVLPVVLSRLLQSRPVFNSLLPITPRDAGTTITAPSLSAARNAAQAARALLFGTDLTVEEVVHRIGDSPATLSRHLPNARASSKGDTWSLTKHDKMLNAGEYIPRTTALLAQLQELGEDSVAEAFDEESEAGVTRSNSG